MTKRSKRVDKATDILEQVIDPTANVNSLVEASGRRLDDLRLLDHTHNKEMNDLERRHFAELRKNESGRIDAILQNVRDTAASTAAAAETRANTLAGQVSTSADAMRAQVAASAKASDDALDRRFGPMQSSIDEIRKFQFETQGGRLGVVDTRAELAELKPIYEALQELKKANDMTSGHRQQIADTQAKGGHTALWIAIGISAATLTSSFFLSAAAIAVTLLLRG